jgi:hypothetical protein
VTTSATSPAAVLRRAVTSDPGRPRVTVYDDTDSPTRGERIELSARVLANWVAKAANLLQDDLDVGPGSVVVLDLPPHWRTLYWALAVWSVGGCVELPSHRTTDALRRRDAVPSHAPAHPGAARAGDAEPSRPSGDGKVLVTDDPTAAGDADRAVLVTLAALARSAPVAVPPWVVDEARELATHGDVLDPWDEPADDDPALRAGGADTAYGEIVPGDATPDRVHTATTDTAAFLRLALGALAGDGSVVLTRGEPGLQALQARLASEGVTSTA